VEQASLANFQHTLGEMEAAAAELVDVGRALFKDGEPVDPELQRRYRLYKRVEAALALPAGPECVAALRAAKIDNSKKH
jgi:hypothetical protein